MLDIATTATGWAVAIKRALQEYGVDGDQILIASGIDPQQSLDPNGRLPVTISSNLTRLATDASGDPAFGLSIGKMMRPTSWHALGFSVWASSTLREAFERMVRYFKIFTTCGSLELIEDDQHLTLRAKVLPAYQPILHYEEYEAFAALVVLTARHLMPEQWNPVEVGLPRPAAEIDTTPFERLFRCPVRFGQQELYIVMDLQEIDAPLPTANPELARTNDQVCAEYIARFDRSDIVAQVYYRLMLELPQGEPPMEQIAESLHISLRTLQRKLSDQGTSYKRLLDELRHDLALQYIQQRHLNISEISYMLGFSQVSSFSRVFKRWTGLPPADYRDRGPNGEE
ncbi:AraC family transcriptional regulator [Motiliproteus coralliicola]|uniref:AraC family transcriptional regulator n=1 Tax=Motiliproteus coralliicola TaxID=2283196 RepID=A0A369WQQ2_9GAMM|nr:AraC family transcriptional regulator [Motiliproteus coralliicola]RDE24400.1 AraC family transcriptional regulator [Motiliproteus coralliicola]